MKIIGIAIITTLLACSTKQPTFIQGYVFSKEKKPLKSIKIVDPYNQNLFSVTNNEGYFRINQLTKGEFLYVFQNDEKIDSIYYIRTHPERGEKYYFVEGRKDTLFIDSK